MSSDYTGNPATSHGVNLPSLSNAVTIKMLVDLLDPLNSSAIHGCSVNVLADWIEFLKQERLAMAGVDTWSSSKTYTEGSLAMDSNPKRVYRATSAPSNTNKRPSENEPTYWVQCDWSRSEILAFSSDQSEVGAPTGIVCTRGASVTRANMVITGNTLRQIKMVVQNMPADNSITIDLSGCAAKFLSTFYGGTATLLSGGYQYGGQVGLNPPATGHDVFTLWAKKGAGDSATTFTVSVDIWGV